MQPPSAAAKASPTSGILSAPQVISEGFFRAEWVPLMVMEHPGSATLIRLKGPEGKQTDQYKVPVWGEFSLKPQSLFLQDLDDKF